MNDKIALILGASSDMGLALTEKLYNKYDVIITHYNNSSAKLEELKQRLGNKIHMIKADFSKETDTDEFIKKIESDYVCPTHIVHLPAQKIEYLKFTKTNWNMLGNDLNIQLRSIYEISKKFLVTMGKNKSGKIIFMLSSCTVNTPKYLTAYTITKYALLGFMKALAVEYADKFITINAVSPSMVETKFLDDVPSLVVEQNAANNPMKRNAGVDDIIPMIEFLLSNKADYITGQNIVISGGSVI